MFSPNPPLPLATFTYQIISLTSFQTAYELS